MVQRPVSQRQDPLQHHKRIAEQAGNCGQLVSPSREDQKPVPHQEDGGNHEGGCHQDRVAIAVQVD
jgi:hypothetical protein